jgi:hypothetical protein
MFVEWLGCVEPGAGRIRFHQQVQVTRRFCRGAGVWWGRGTVLEERAGEGS